MRGRLRVYLGAAPGVGKTYRMLDEGRRRADRGTDVVIGYVECHGRSRTEEMIGDLEMVPRLTRAYRDARFTEMDVDAVLARKPEVALVDELAHTNVPGGRNEKRWQDVRELLDAGIEVITTVNIQHLESLNDVVEKITGVPQRETVPDDVVRAADQVELVDMSPEALRRRMAHGSVYSPEKIDAALSNYFRVGNLTALRELALLWVADRVDEGLKQYRDAHGIGGVWEARERVVVALTGGAEGGTLIRRAARIAARAVGGDVLAVHVARSDGLADASPADLAAQRRLVESLGGTYHMVVGDDVTQALLEFARAVSATQLVLGSSRRNRVSRLMFRGIGETVIALSGDIDVHIVTHERAGKGRWPAGSWGRFEPRRQLAALAAAIIAPPALAALLTQVRGSLNLTSQVLVFLVALVAIARLGGLLPALLAAVSSSLLLNYYFIPPIHKFSIADPNNIFALAAFVLVALTVASVVDTAGRQSRRAAHSSAEAQTLATLADSVLRGEEAIPALLERSREAFGMESVALLERSGRDDWRMVAATGPRPCTSPADGDAIVPVSDGVVLVLRGRVLPASDQRVLTAFAAQVGVALEQARLAAAAAAAKPLAEADRMRTALLAAVSHDLRTPLASAKAAVTSLRSHDVDWSLEDSEELLATADESLDRLTRMVENLLDMSRLQAGALSLSLRPVTLDEIVPLALDGLGFGMAKVQLVEMDDVPQILADPGLLERAVANLVSNAVKHSPPGRPVLITASSLGGRVELRVADRGPGIAREDRERVFQPFQRFGDRNPETGVGLGLALSRGLIEAMGGSLEPEDTPGGGLTMVISLPVSSTAGPGTAGTAGASTVNAADAPGTPDTATTTDATGAADVDQMLASGEAGE
ncbi:MAG TPA: ATP-binding protein [Streptosporangiaceae bacterium]|nr:ATP-binding protein [Streptosporangiaceae bacterium]